MASKWGGVIRSPRIQVRGWSSEKTNLGENDMCWWIGLTQVRKSFFGKACCYGCYGECPLVFNIFLSSPLEGIWYQKWWVFKYGVSLSIYVKFRGCISIEKYLKTITLTYLGFCESQGTWEFSAEGQVRFRCWKNSDVTGRHAKRLRMYGTLPSWRSLIVSPDAYSMYSI